MNECLKDNDTVSKHTYAQPSQVQLHTHTYDWLGGDPIKGDPIKPPLEPIKGDPLLGPLK